jgi:type II secretory pathway pseudopilin PulG
MGKWRGQSGITFISVIFMVSIIGIMLAMTAQSWSGLMKREREEELLFRGMQIFQAISTWQRPKAGHPPTPLRELKDLLKDPRSLANVRYLRKLYTDPITGKEFELIKGGPNGGIVGVKSTSKMEPVKKGNFPPSLKHLENKKSYSEWLFGQKKYLPADTVQPPGGAGPPIMQGGTEQPK